ncbi:hypothetical protein GY45DRAFT_1341651, partial [Cubamyces sp. BRFM 1775]
MAMTSWNPASSFMNTSVSQVKIVIGAARLADTMVIGFGIRPDWNPRRPLHPDAIDVRVLLTQQFEQQPGLKAVVQKLERIIREELALPHILAFRDKLDQITPGPGYAFDAASRRIITHPVQLAPNVPIRQLHSSRIASRNSPVPKLPMLPTQDMWPRAWSGMLPGSNVNKGWQGYIQNALKAL